MMDHSYKELLKMRRFPHTWCPGCGIGSVLKNVAMVMKELGWNDHNTVAVSGIGCSGRMSGYMNLDGVHTPHGRALTAAEAIKTVRPELNVVVLSGDGDLGSIGGNHLLHTYRRNPDITVFCNDNEIYGLTGGQAGPTTPQGTKTITSPRGNPTCPFDWVGSSPSRRRIFTRGRPSITSIISRPAFEKLSSGRGSVSWM